MNESIQLEEGKYLDSKSVSYKRKDLESHLDSINSDYDRLTLNTTDAITSNLFTISNYKIKEDGTYLLAGVLLPNAYGQNGRALTVRIYRNDSLLQSYMNVFNLYTYTYSCAISCIAKFRKNDVIKIVLENSVVGLNFAFSGGQLTILKLNDETY